MPRPLPAVKLSPAERDALEKWAGRCKTAQGLSTHARILCWRTRGLPTQPSRPTSPSTRPPVSKWRNLFLCDRVEGLYDQPRSGAPRRIDDAQVEALVLDTLESRPEGATHWSSRLIAKRHGLSHASVQRIWHAFGLKPHRTRTFKLSTDPNFVGKVRDIVGLYLDPPTRAVVLCVDEKSQIQALDRSQPVVPLRPGDVERRTHDYKRHGMTSLFAALDIATGRVIGQCQTRHRASEFRAFLDTIEATCPPTSTCTW